MLSNNKIARARTTDEYVDMINQAIDEVFDLRQAIEFDEEFISDGRAVVDQLEQSLKDIHASMKDGSYEFATGDLPYVALLENHRDSLIPFKYLLKRINETHNRGLDISES